MPIPLSPAYDASSLRAAARMSKDAGQTRRLLALAAIYDGATRTEAAAMGNVTVQIVRDWVLKLNAHGPDGLIDYRGPGPRRILSDMHRTALAAAIEDGPTPAIHGVVSVAVGHVPGRRVAADAEPRTARDGVSQAVGPATSPCPGRRSHRRF
jgi:hypothetical protein